MRRVIVLLPFLTACSATVLTPPPVASPNAPVNELTRPGIVTYPADGWKSLERKRRQDAYRKMRERCGGPYRIDAEGPRVVGERKTGPGRVEADQEWYIAFSCVR